MLIYVAVHLLYSHHAHALPSGIAPRADATENTSGQVEHRLRTIEQIITSCFSTFILCTWSALHPNIPPHTEGEVHRFFRQLRLWLTLLFLPETVLLWATLQFLGARKLAKTPEFKVRGWKITHGFFAQMGGFLLHDADGKPLHVVWSKDICAMLRSPLIETPRLTEEEIADRSKSDFVSKVFAIVQTTSFFAQCITRLAKRLPITELELITFTYTIVNVYVYAVFFKKPQNVGYPFPVYEKTVANGGRKWIREDPLKSRGGGLGRKFLHYLKLVSAAPVYGINVWAINQEARGIQATTVPDLYYHGQKRISSGRILALCALLGSSFGASHLIAWNVNLGYPSFAQEVAWRASCISLTIIPPILLVLVLIPTTYGDVAPKILSTICAAFVGPIITLLYLVARLALLGLPLAALRNLPSEVFIATPSIIPFKYLGNWQG